MSGLALRWYALVLLAASSLAPEAHAQTEPRFVLAWGGSCGSVPGLFDGSGGIATDGPGRVYVADGGNNRIQVFDGTGALLAIWGGIQGSGDGQFFFPTDVAVGASGLVYVLDNGNSRIQKFDATGGFLKKWGFLCVVPGDCDGGFVGPYAIALDAHENIYVADTGNHRVQKFDSEGNFIRKWGTRGTGPAEFTEPKRICVDANGDVYVGDFHGVHRFDADGNFISQFGAPRVGNVLSLGVDPNGTIYAGNSSDVSLFSRDGAFLLAWDGSDVPPVEDCMHNVPTGTGSGLTLTDITFDSGQYIYATHAWGVFKFLWGPTPLKPTSWSAVKKTYRE